MTRNVLAISLLLCLQVLALLASCQLQLLSLQAQTQPFFCHTLTWTHVLGCLPLRSTLTGVQPHCCPALQPHHCPTPQPSDPEATLCGDPEFLLPEPLFPSTTESLLLSTANTQPSFQVKHQPKQLLVPAGVQQLPVPAGELKQPLVSAELKQLPVTADMQQLSAPAEV